MGSGRAGWQPCQERQAQTQQDVVEHLVWEQRRIANGDRAACTHKKRPKLMLRWLRPGGNARAGMGEKRGRCACGEKRSSHSRRRCRALVTLSSLDLLQRTAVRTGRVQHSTAVDADRLDRAKSLPRCPEVPPTRMPQRAQWPQSRAVTQDMRHATRVTIESARSTQHIRGLAFTVAPCS